MDLSKIDEIIELLEKKKSLRPGSPPVVVGGHLGVWRMIRGMRTFIELDNHNKDLGNILIGPPSFIGHKLDNIPSDVWEAMTPRATMEAFSGVHPAPNGVDTLKESIKNSLGPDDTRRTALDSLNTVEQLVPIARSTGFTDDNIKRALDGDSPNKPLENSTSIIDRGKGNPTADRSNMPLPNNVVQLRPRKKTPTDSSEAAGSEGMSPARPAAPAAPAGPTEPPEPPAGKPKPDTAAVTHNIHELQGSLALSPSAMKEEGKATKEANMAAFLEKLAENSIKNDDLLQQRVKDLATGLRAGKYTYTQVQDEVRNIISNYNHVRQNQLTAEERQAAQDAATVKDFIDNFEANLEDRINEGIDRAHEKFKPNAAEGSHVSDERVNQLAEEHRRAAEEAKAESEKNRAAAEAAQAQSAKDRKEAEKQREQANIDRQKAREFMTQAQFDQMQIESAIALLQELADKVNNEKVKKELQVVIQSVRKGSFSRRSIFLRLYQLLQILMLLIPGLG